MYDINKRPVVYPKTLSVISSVKLYDQSELNAELSHIYWQNMHYKPREK